MELQVKKWKVNFSTTPLPQGNTLSQVPLISPKVEKNYSFPQLRGRTIKTYFKMHCYKSTFIKHVTEECTFCWKILLVTLRRNLVATIAEFLSLFVTFTIIHSIAWNLPAWTESYTYESVFYLTKYNFNIITNVFMW